MNSFEISEISFKFKKPVYMTSYDTLTLTWNWKFSEDTEVVIKDKNGKSFTFKHKELSEELKKQLLNPTRRDCKQ